VTDSLNELKYTLMSGVRLSMQRSLGRRAPAKAALPDLIRARDGLRRFVHECPTSAESWELLSRAEECLLDYQQAIVCLQKSMSLSGKRDKRDVKRLALLKESLSEWSALPLTPGQLRELGGYLAVQGANEEKLGRTLKFTEQWLEDKGFSNAQEIIQGLKNRGGYTDFMILYNVVRG